MKKKVSIVLPTFNGASRIERAVYSIVNQSYHNFELIIVNDCSTDNTAQIIDNLAKQDCRIRVVSNSTNQKLPKSLNIGFSVAEGEYLTWTSDDNEYKTEAISKMVAFLEDNQNVDMVYADFSIVHMDGTVIRDVNANEPDDLKFQNTVGACFLYRKELAEKIGDYDSKLFLAEDYEYWIRAYLQGNVKHISENLYNYGWHDESLTVTKKEQVYHKTYEAKDKHFDELLARCVTQEERDKFFCEMLRLLLDEDERRIVRKRYYSLDPIFMKNDRKKRAKDRFDKSIMGRSLRRIVGSVHLRQTEVQNN